MTLRSTREDELRALTPRGPSWLRQVHGNTVIDLDASSMEREGDAALTRVPGTVCAIKAADCMPVLLTDEAGTVVAGAHAGWRGLAAGVIEATIHAMGVPGSRLIAWMGPAIGPGVYEVGDEVRAVFEEKDAFSPARPGHWLLDLYAVARHRLKREGVQSVFGGGFCTFSDPQRFYSYRRDGSTGRMAALIWLT
ncbi:MAG TPA: peptidoglycan editing factor PgeF [Burkholderiales bacterium]|nr:peptidoglycan editing factor PgeF [Burkholderiales bacterium]